MENKKYIAVLDYDHLDNGMFLTAFAKALSGQENGAGIIIHGDSAYTERLIQTGMMRDEARTRAVKDLNHRLIALFADSGVSTIGLNGFQRELISSDGHTSSVDSRQLDRLPSSAFLLLSNLIHHREPGKIKILPLVELANLLSLQLDIPEIVVFSMDESDEIIRRNISPENSGKSTGLNRKLPVEFRDVDFRFRLSSTAAFSRFPDMKQTMVINGS